MLMVLVAIVNQFLQKIRQIIETSNKKESRSITVLRQTKQQILSVRIVAKRILFKDCRDLEITCFFCKTKRHRKPDYSKKKKGELIAGQA